MVDMAGRKRHGDRERRGGAAGEAACQSPRRARAWMAGVVAVTLAGLLALTGCSSAQSGDSAARGVSGDSATGSADYARGEAAAEAPNESAPQADADMAGATAGQDDTSAGEGGSASVALFDERKIIRTATIAVKISVTPQADDEDPDDTRAALADAVAEASTKARAFATGAGGFVSASDGSGSTVSLTLRVPTDRYDSVMNSLSDLGRVTSRVESTQDVTSELVDVASRIETMEASVKRVRALLAEADRIADVISIESELASREADLESLQNRQKALEGQVALSTITATVTAVAETAETTPVNEDRSAFLDGLADGWHALTTFGSGVAVFVGAILPWLPLIAIVIVALVLIAKRLRRTPAPELAVPTSPAGPGE